MLGQVGRALPPDKDWESLGILREEVHLLWPGTCRWAAGLQDGQAAFMTTWLLMTGRGKTGGRWLDRF